MNNKTTVTLFLYLFSISVFIRILLHGQLMDALKLLPFILALVGVIWLIHDVFFVNKTLSKTQKTIWTICAILFTIITVMVYYFIEKRKKKSQNV